MISVYQLHVLVQTTVLVAVTEPGWTVRVTVRVRFRAKRCEVVTPLAVAPSPKFQLYEVAPVEELASKLQVRLEQLLVKLAVTVGGGGGGDPPPPMNAV
jgi:hypothetical protein